MRVDEIAELVASEAAHAEATRDDPYPADTVFERRNAPRSTVYSIRLSAEEVVAVQQAAATAHIPPATLVRSWIKDRLADRTDTEDRIRAIIREELHTALHDKRAA